MSDQPCKTPLLELARSVPKELRAEWETQWFEDGTPCGHAMAPVGQYVHDLADEIERLQSECDEHAGAYRRCSEERAKLQAVVDAAIEVIQDEQVYEGGTTYSLMKMEKALAALKGADDE